MKPRTMSWAGYLAHTGENSNTYEVLVEKPIGKRQLERQGIDGRIMFILI
jgi:hypothetical protein